MISSEMFAPHESINRLASTLENKMEVINALHWRIATNYYLTSINVKLNCMRVKAVIFIISLLLLAGTAVAVGNPDTITVETNKQWIPANNIDQSTITVTVTNTTTSPGPVSGVLVTLAINDSVYGTLSATVLTTDASGKASSTFNGQKVVRHR
jgi:hypothetical protein